MITTEIHIIKKMSSEERRYYLSLQDNKEAQDNFFFEMYEKYMWHSIESTGKTREEFWESVREVENEYIEMRRKAEKK